MGGALSGWSRAERLKKSGVAMGVGRWAMWPRGDVSRKLCEAVDGHAHLLLPLPPSAANGVWDSR